MVYIYDPHFLFTYCSVHPLRKAKFCGVPSGAIVKVGCPVGKKSFGPLLWDMDWKTGTDGGLF
jgi:hypothetical protein